ncbi:MarR family winged helix-turn-helix transcriptional regulator [Nocardia callitridis]|uniref:HTH marR-type domain-containing protein n=1 Tax=Nocardia callitridis TaxID=648753 RepID=A0ABP9JYZ7_9NOCA
MSVESQDAELDVGELTGVLENFTRMFISLPSLERLSFTTLSVLHRLEGGGPRRLTELTASEQVTQSAITQIVIKLERQGYVRRTPDPTDRRAVLVDITSQGSAIVKNRRGDRIDRLDELVARLDRGEKTAISTALPALTRLVELDHARSREHDES